MHALRILSLHICKLIKIIQLKCLIYTHIWKLYFERAAWPMTTGSGVAGHYSPIFAHLHSGNLSLSNSPLLILSGSVRLNISLSVCKLQSSALPSDFWWRTHSLLLLGLLRTFRGPKATLGFSLLCALSVIAMLKGAGSGAGYPLWYLCFTLHLLS